MKPLWTLLLLFFFVSGFSQSKYVKVGIGRMHMVGDVKTVPDIVNTVQVSGGYQVYKRAFVDVAAGYGQFLGASSVIYTTSLNNGALMEDIYQGLEQNFYNPNYKRNHGYVDAAIVYRQDLESLKFGFNIGFGAGVSIGSTHINLMNEEGEYHDTRALLFSSFSLDPEEILEFYDSDFETEMTLVNNVNPHIVALFGVQVQLVEGFTLAMDVRSQYLFSDYVDGIKYTSGARDSENNDYINIITLSTVYVLP